MKTYLLFIITALVLTPSIALAQRYLIDLPIDAQGSFEAYINLLYKLSISIAALLAVVKIVIAGAKYMLSDVISNKSEAKKDIRGALLGLLLIIGAVIILNTINPALTDGGLNIKRLERIKTNEDVLSPVAAGAFGLNQSGAEGILAATTQTGSCVIKAPPVKEQNSTLYSIDTTRCPNGSDAFALGAFTQACIASGGTRSPGGTTGLLSCRVPAAGAAGGRDLATNISNTNFVGGGRIDSQFITRTNGTTITTNLAAACRDMVKDAPADNQNGLNNNCLQFGQNTIESQCEKEYGKYNGSNTSAIVCKLPKEVVSISTLTKALDAYKAADVSREFLTFNNLSLEQERAVCKLAGGTHYDENGTNNSCIFY